MFKILKKEINWGGRKLTLETGRIARQANGSVLATYGGTSVLCTVVISKEPKEGVDFLPLTVSYQEKTFAAGKIPGGFFKREAKPSEKETLISRLIDRPIRPLFPDNYYNEIQIICTLLNLDKSTSPDVVAFIGASAALALAGAPVEETVASAKVGYVDKKFVLNPSNEDLEKSDLNLMVAGTKDGVLMVESEVKELSEKEMLDAVMFAHKEFQSIIKFIDVFIKEKKVVKIEYKNENTDNLLKDLYKKVQKNYQSKFIEAYKEKEKSLRSNKLEDIRNKILEELITDENEEITENFVSSATKKVEKEWGYEVWLANNKEESYCGKILFIKKGKSTSMHYHLDKHETFYVLEGTLVIESLSDRDKQDHKVTMMCEQGESMEMERGRAHKLIALGTNLRLIEISTFHKDEDSYRLWR